MVFLGSHERLSRTEAVVLSLCLPASFLLMKTGKSRVTQLPFCHLIQNKTGLRQRITETKRNTLFEKTLFLFSYDDNLVLLWCLCNDRSFNQLFEQPCVLETTTLLSLYLKIVERLLHRRRTWTASLTLLSSLYLHLIVIPMTWRYCYMKSCCAHEFISPRTPALTRRDFLRGVQKAFNFENFNYHLWLQ
jgi:hypothetical protein